MCGYPGLRRKCAASKGNAGLKFDSLELEINFREFYIEVTIEATGAGKKKKSYLRRRKQLSKREEMKKVFWKPREW